MTSKHTPGPWRASLTPYEGYLRVESNTGHAVAQVYATSFDKDGAREANAKLIAAAPEMLAAAELGLMALDPSAPDYATIKAAIEKAKG